MKKMTLAVFLSSISVGVAYPAEKIEKEVITQERSLPVFSSVVLNGISKVRIHQGEQNVKVTVDRRFADRYETRVINGRLVLGYKCGFSFSAWRAVKNLGKCEVDITLPYVEKIEVNGNGVLITDPLKNDSLKLEVNGSGTVEIHGSVSQLAISCTGAATVRCRDLSAENVHVSMTGAGDVELSAEKTLEVSITGAGSLKYWGYPQLSQKITGAGETICGEKAD